MSLTSPQHFRSSLPPVRLPTSLPPRNESPVSRYQLIFLSVHARHSRNSDWIMTTFAPRRLRSNLLYYHDVATARSPGFFCASSSSFGHLTPPWAFLRVKVTRPTEPKDIVLGCHVLRRRRRTPSKTAGNTRSPALPCQPHGAPMTLRENQMGIAEITDGKNRSQCVRQRY